MTAHSAPTGTPAAERPIEPYRLLFPVGMLLAWAGVLHWLLHSLHLLDRYQSVFHSIAQIQGFLMCFAVGFLFTAIPARTGTPPPRTWQLAVAVAAPVLTTAAAWAERWAMSQFFWFVLVVVVVEFAVRRFRSPAATRRPPTSFIWVPVALAMGVMGSMLTGPAAVFGGQWFWYHDLGRLLLLQGMFLGLVLGVGGMLLPLLFHGANAPATKATPDHSEWRERGIHLAAAAFLAGTFWIENSGSIRLGLMLRAVLLVAVMRWTGAIARRPTLPGLHRKLVWLAAWLLPAGYVLAAAFPHAIKAGLHVVFIAGFSLMTFAVGRHVTLAHGGYAARVGMSPWPTAGFGGLLLLATGLRALADFDRSRFFFWIGAAAASFLLATVCWGIEVLPRMIRHARPDGS